MSTTRESGAAGGTRDAGPARFVEGMSRLAAAVNVVTTNGPGGVAGLTASAVCSVSASPPSLLVCLNRSANSYAAFRRNNVLCVNTLAARQGHLAQAFAGGRAPTERFSIGTWSALETGSPALRGALVSFDCRIASIVNSGSHDVLICDVVAVRLGVSEDQGLMYYRRGYRSVSAA